MLAEGGSGLVVIESGDELVASSPAGPVDDVRGLGRLLSPDKPGQEFSDFGDGQREEIRCRDSCC